MSASVQRNEGENCGSRDCTYPKGESLAPATKRSPVEPNRSVDQLSRDLMELVGHRHFGRCRDASFLSCFTKLGRLEELARPCRVLVFSKEDEIVGFV